MKNPSTEELTSPIDGGDHGPEINRREFPQRVADFGNSNCNIREPGRLQRAPSTANNVRHDMHSVSCLDSYKFLKGRMTACSAEVGWRSLLLRAYDEPVEVDEFTTPPTADQLIVLVKAGSTTIQSFGNSGWRTARYAPGDIGMTAPGAGSRLRWYGGNSHSNLQLHLPTSVLYATSAALSKRDPALISFPDSLLTVDPLIKQVMLSLEAAMHLGFPDIYAESAAHFLAAHILSKNVGLSVPSKVCIEDTRLRRVDSFIRANLAEPVSLTDFAEVACLSRYHLVRLFKQTYGVTPFQRLTRFRMEYAQNLLMTGRKSIIEIALLCGYNNASHFATAFRRFSGATASEYRLKAR